MALRRQLEGAFRSDTASEGFPTGSPSSGHCAAVAAIVHELIGGELVSARVSGHSHWLNRVRSGTKNIDFDLTGDQFGLPPFQIAEAGKLYPHTRERNSEELTEETLMRAGVLAERAGLTKAALSLRAELARRLTAETNS